MHPIGSVFLSLLGVRRGAGVLDFWVLSFSTCSHQVLNQFPMSSSHSECVPQHVPNIHLLLSHILGPRCLFILLFIATYSYWVPLLFIRKLIPIYIFIYLEVCVRTMVFPFSNFVNQVDWLCIIHKSNNEPKSGQSSAGKV